MKYTYKGKIKENSKITDFIIYLDSIPDNSQWLHNGMKVEIDPTVDYSDENVLIRWRDIEEGFNDKYIFNNLNDFKHKFQLIND